MDQRDALSERGYVERRDPIGRRVRIRRHVVDATRLLAHARGRGLDFDAARTEAMARVCLPHGGGPTDVHAVRLPAR